MTDNTSLAMERLSAIINDTDPYEPIGAYKDDLRAIAAALSPVAGEVGQNQSPLQSKWLTAWAQLKPSIPRVGRSSQFIDTIDDMFRDLIVAHQPTASIAPAVYEAAVKGRQDFRQAYRELLSVQRAAAALCLLWRTPGEKIGSDAFMEALNALDVATSGGGRNGIAKPKLEAIAAALSPVADEVGPQPYTGAPPPHWTPGGTHPSSNGEIRYPATVAEWDYRNDPTGDARKDLALRRIRFSYTMADPRAPDQMALVHRKDLGDLMNDLIRFRAYFNLKHEQDAHQPAASIPPAGWRMVPIQATARILNAAGITHGDWSAMLAAAPQPPAQPNDWLASEISLSGDKTVIIRADDLQRICDERDEGRNGK